ncbi:O-methyltransferase [Pholiota molesta]|nr:O-methyltransferase [Pholiota molesta]
MTIAVLRSLHEIIGHAIDEIEHTYASHGRSTDSGPSSTCQTPIQTPIATGDGSEGSRGADKPPISRHKQSLSNSQAYVSPPPSPSTTTSSCHISSPQTSPATEQSSILPVDFPLLDAPCDPGSLSEALTTHPAVLNAIGRIVAAAGQLGVTVQTPFLTLCEATMGYHLPSCMRLLEASHVVEILREAGPAGLDVQVISEKNGVAPSKLAHILRLLATHHLLREVSPDVFALNRLSSLIDSGKSFAQLKQFETEGRPEMKYRDTDGIAAFVGLCTDEIQKSAAYMTETYYLSPSQKTREGADPVRAPFCFAFDTVKSGTGFFGWLEGETAAASNVTSKPTSLDGDESIKPGRGGVFPPTLPETSSQNPRVRQNRSLSERARAPVHAPHSRHPPSLRQKRAATVVVALSPTPTSTDSDSAGTVKEAEERRVDREAPALGNPNKFRLERFGKAMSGTDGWEVPGAVLNGFDWASLPRGSVIVDVGGGIGSTTMILATAFASTEDDALSLRFVIQDRAVVCEMGEKAWKAKRPELLGSTVEFQVQDFFEPQPVKDAAVFLLRVVLHDWPDDFARKILLRLREAASPETKLLIADFVLPLACPDDTSSDGVLEDASSNVYWMDLTMQVMFNAQERTLREMVILALSAGWKIIKVTKTPGSLFGYLVAVPVAIPQRPKEEEPELAKDAFTDDAPQATVGNDKNSKMVGISYRRPNYRETIDIQRSSSRCGTPTFGSNMRLSSVEETFSRFAGGILRSKGVNRSVSSPYASVSKTPPALKSALSLTSTSSTGKKKKPSPLTMPPMHSSPSPVQSPRWLPSASPRNEQFKAHSPPAGSASRTMPRRMSLANLRPHSQHATLGPPPPLPALRQQPPSPLSPRGGHAPLGRRASQAHLSQHIAGHGQGPLSPLPSFIPVRSNGSTEPSSPRSSPHLLGAAASITPPVAPARVPARVITRRASTAQLLSQTSIRKRSGTITASAFGTNGSRTDRIGSLSDTGTVLKFDCRENAGCSQRSSPSTRSQSPILESVGVLAAAAKIESEGFGQSSASL